VRQETRKQTCSSSHQPSSLISHTQQLKQLNTLHQTTPGEGGPPQTHNTYNNIPAKMPHRVDRINDEESQMDSWLERSLRSIAGCTDASSAEPPTVSMSHIITNSDEGNRNLQDLIIWLENHAIRQWKLDDRKALVDNFDDAFERYLADLDCPTEYRRDTRSGGSSGDGNIETNWRANPESRGKVVFWVVYNAISETYLDQRPSLESSDNASSQGEHLNKIIDKDSFPLGFSTNDANMDGILMTLRMKYLLDLRQIQTKVNESVAEMQKLTVKR
jgi:hypothetical protein